MVKKLRKIPKADVFLVIMPVGALLLSLFLAGLFYLIPYDPYVFYDFDAMPTEACPREKVEVTLDREIREGFNIREIDVKSEWVAIDAEDSAVKPGQAEVSGTATIYEPEPNGREVVPSPIKRSAPAIPGEWGIRSTVDIRGSMFGLPRSQRVVLESEDPITVLPSDSPKCKGA